MKYKSAGLLLVWFIEKDCERYDCRKCGFEKYCYRAVDIVVEGNKNVKGIKQTSDRAL